MLPIRHCLLLLSCLSLLSWFVSSVAAAEPAKQPTPQEVLDGLKSFFAKTARPDGSFTNGIDPDYMGMSDSAYSDLAAVTYATTLSKTFGWKLPHEQKTIEWLLARQKPTGEFVNVAGTVDPAGTQGKVYNTTQALVALRALGVKPKHDPLPVFEEILKADYKTLPAFSTSFFPLAYLCAGKPIPAQADRSIRALMIQDREGYLNDHVAATFHASHYYALVGDPTPMAKPMVERMLRDQAKDGSWFLNQPARDRHATFDAVFTLVHEGGDREDCRNAIARAARWALSCRNPDGGFGHYPGQVSDADANYFQVGALVMAGFLKPVDPLPPDPHLLSWGHTIPVRKRPDPAKQVILPYGSWVSGIAMSDDGKTMATALGNGEVELHFAGTDILRPVLGHEAGVRAVAVSRDGKRVATGGVDGRIVVLDIPASSSFGLNKHRGSVLALAFSPDGATLASGSIDGTIRLWDPTTGDERRALTGHKSWVNSLAFHSGGEQLVSASSDGTLKVWNVKTGDLVKTIPATKAEVRSVAWSADGKWIAAGIRYGQVKWWSTETWKEEKVVELKADDVSAILISPDSQRVLAGTGEWNRPGRVEVLDIATGDRVKTLHHTGEVLSLAQSKDGKVIAAGGGDRAVSIWKK